jgi:mannose-6-phosphate isomerase-like protein (cupin superfamily)
MGQKRKVDCAEALEKHGVFTNHEQMSNGEYRFRLVNKDGSSYIRTVAALGGWQNSHHHSAMRETYIVQSGWMAIAQRIEGRRSIYELQPGGIITTTPLVAHNVYLPGGAIIHTVKHGIATGADWYADVDFDNETTELSEEDIHQLAEHEIT